MKKLTIAYLLCLAYFSQDVQAFQYDGGTARNGETVGENFIRVILRTLTNKSFILEFDSNLGFEAFSDAVLEAVGYRDGNIILSGKIISKDNFDEYVRNALTTVTTLHVVEVLNEEEQFVRDAERAARVAARDAEKARLAQEKEKEDREEALELGFDERSLRDSGASENGIRDARNAFLESERMGLQLVEQEIARQERERLIAEAKEIDLQQRQQPQQKRSVQSFIHVILVTLTGTRVMLEFDSNLGFEAFSDAVLEAVGYRDATIILSGEKISKDNFDEYVRQALTVVTTLHVVEVLNEEEKLARDAERAARVAARDAEKARLGQR